MAHDYNIVFKALFEHYKHCEKDSEECSPCYDFDDIMSALDSYNFNEFILENLKELKQ